MMRAGLLVLGAAVSVSAESYDTNSAEFIAAMEGRRGLQAADQNICSGPSGGVVTAETGTLSDDQTGPDHAVDCTQGGCSGYDTGHNGYGDNLSCMKTIEAPAGSVIELTIAQIALEQDPCPEPGCDYLTVYDGPNMQSPVLGTYSGTEIPRPVRSTGNTMTVMFSTDAGNYGLQTARVSDDPGFYADWHFVQQINDAGYGICPVAAVVTEMHGTLHDDDGDMGTVDCTQMACGSTDNAGYNDNQNCYTTIQAPAGDFVRFTFTQMNLEGPQQPGTVFQKPGCMPCTDTRGCDYVALYDGADESAPLIGTYSGHHLGWNGGGSGNAEDYLPSVVSSGNQLHVRFITDTHNCGIDASEDPGWIADWDFIENGQDICHPDAAVLREPHGTLHDDAPGGAVNCQNGNCGSGTGGGEQNGYGDNLDCGVRIRAPSGQTVNVHFTQMNLEGGTNGICGNSYNQFGQIDCSNGGDYVEVFDGRNANAPSLSGQLTGDVTDDRIVHDTYTSTGRDLFVRFVTDAGNYGLTGTTDDPGFWMEWQFIEEGADCMSYSVIQGRGIVGHNNEVFTDRTARECEELCCARDWCRSFDFLGMQGGQVPEGGSGQCALSDVDVTTNQATNTEWGSDIYERNNLATIAAIGSAASCASELAQKAGRINNLCCPSGGCERGTPDVCSEECATIWSPFAKRCSVFLEGSAEGQPLIAITELCEREEWGRYTAMSAASGHGRCGNGDLLQWIDELGPACCGDGGDPGTPASPHCKDPAVNLGGQTVFLADTCTPQCADMFEEMYSECHPRFETMGIADEMHGILAACQGIPLPSTPGGGHRRNLLTADFEAVVASILTETADAAPTAAADSTFA